MSLALMALFAAIVVILVRHDTADYDTIEEANPTICPRCQHSWLEHRHNVRTGETYCRFITGSNYEDKCGCPEVDPMFPN